MVYFSRIGQTKPKQSAFGFPRSPHSHNSSLERGDGVRRVHGVRHQFLGGQRMPGAEGTGRIHVLVVVVAATVQTRRRNVLDQIDVRADGQQ